jgi:hypothetical protein
LTINLNHQSEFYKHFRTSPNYQLIFDVDLTVINGSYQ